ncbi:transposase [Pseudomonas juntendi]|nr:transposase [Pseudomonas juntendi]
MPANTGVAGASHRAGFFAGMPAPTQWTAPKKLDTNPISWGVHMSKYSDQFKLTAVHAYLEGGEGFRKVAQRLAVDFSLLRRWVSSFQKHGQFSLRKPGQRYSATYKRSVLEYMHKHQLSLRQTAAHFGLGQSSQIGIWARQYYSGSPASPAPKRRKPAAMSKKPYPIKPTTSDDTDKSRDQLLAELEWLRMENAYLKKLEELKKQERRQPKKP